ncbi:hypothetical protein PGB90_006813 [Kerria lacca]
MSEEDEIDLNYALNYFVNYKQAPDHIYFEHTYSQPFHKKYYIGYSSPAKYLFTSPVPETSSNSEYVDVETLDHPAPLYFDPEKLNEQLRDNEAAEYDENWADKVDRKDWNIIKVRLFKLAVQIVEADYLSRLAYKGLKDEVVKRNIIIKKSALRFKSLFSSVAWNPHTCQWLHNLLIEKLPSCFIKVYTDAFQCLETKVPSHLLEHMTISTSYMSVRSRLLGSDNQNNPHKKHFDLFSTLLTQHKPKKITGDPLLILVPTNVGNSFAPNSRRFRFMTELSLLGTLVTVTYPKNYSGNTEIPTLLEQMIQATVSKIIEIQTDHPGRPIILIGVGASSLLACHIALGFNQKITGVVCIGFNIFTMDRKIGKANDKLLNMKTPVLFVIGQNSTTVTIDEIEEFRLRLRCRTGLVVVGGADDHLRVNHFLKKKCSVTQSIVDRCIVNEIFEFLNDIMQPAKVLLSLLSNNDSISIKPKATVSSVDAQLLKKLINETVKEPNSPIIQKLTKTLAQLQADHEYGTQSKRITNSNKHLESNNNRIFANKSNENDFTRKSLHGSEETKLKKILTSNNSSSYRFSSISNYPNSLKNHPKISVQYQISNSDNNFKKSYKDMNVIHTTLAPVNFTRKTRGGRRPYVRRTIPPKGNMVVISSFPSEQQPTEINHETKNLELSIDNLTPDNLLDMPVVFADENDDENVINDVSLTSCQP